MKKNGKWISIIRRVKNMFSNSFVLVQFYFLFSMGKKKEAAAAASSSSSSPGVSSTPIAKHNKKMKKTEKAIGQFLSDILPNLKKEMVKKKKEPFSFAGYEAVLKPDSGFVQTYLLPLFKFLEKDEIICSRYGCFENRHMVKTNAGYERVMILSRWCDSEDLTAEVLSFLTQRYGKEWFKIPAKDGFRAKAAASTGFGGCFKVILVGLYEDTFQDKTTGETIHSINPSLIYEPCRAPPVKKERAPTTAKAKEKKVVEEEDRVSPAQVIEIDPIVDYDDDRDD